MMSKLPINILELVAALEGLNKENLNDEHDLFWICQDVFGKLKRLSDFDPGDLKKTIKILRDLPPEIKELKIEEIEDGDKKLETRALNKQDLKELIENYEKAQNPEERRAIGQKIKKAEEFINRERRINEERKKEAKKPISELVEEYKKAGAEEKAVIGKEIYFRSGEKETETYVQKRKEVVERNIKELEQLSPENKEILIDNLTKINSDYEEKVAKIVEKAIIEEKFNLKIVEKEIKKVVKNSEKTEEIVQNIAEVRAEIEVKQKAEEFAQSAYKKLVEEKIPVSSDIQTKLKNEILIAWKGGEELKIPKELVGIKESEIIIRETEKRVESFKSENLRIIVNYRAGELAREISQDLRQKGINDEKLIEEYALVVNKFTNNPETIVSEENRNEIYNFVESKNPSKSPGEIERSIDEAQFMAKNVTMAPKKFNKLIGRYNQIREKIGADKLPKIKEVRVMEKMTALFKNNPRVLGMMNVAQRTVGVLGKVYAFPTRLMGRMGGKIVEKFGGKVLEKIGGQAAVEFTKHAAAIIAKEGTIQGIRTIAGALFTKGTVTMGTTAAGGTAAGGSLATILAAFQALPVVGQVIAVVVLAVVAVVAIVKPIVDGAKKFLGKILNVDMNGVKHFISDSLGLGNFIGGVGQFVFDVGTFLIGIPTLIGMVGMGALVAPVVIFFFIGMLVYSLFSENLISSIVPPIQTGGGTNCVLESTLSEEDEKKVITGGYTDENGNRWVCFGEGGTGGEIPEFIPWNPTIPIEEGCPSGMPTSGYFTQGPFAQGCSHQSMSSPAVDIGAGNGTAIVATHPGVAVLGYDGIYGYYIDVHGKCEEKDFYTRYAHMPAGGYAVKSNQTVSAGQKIGVVNNTGSSTGPHLHYHITGLDTNKFGQYLGLTVQQTQQLWGCCGSWNGKYCP